MPFLVVDTDSDQYRKIGAVKKVSTDANIPDRRLEKGDEMEFRMFFEVPRDAKLKQLTYGWSGGRKWALDISQVT